MFQTIRLPGGEWEYDPDVQLGRTGGFGAVFLGRSAQHGDVAVKRLKLEASRAAHRELAIATDLAGKSFNHIIPIYDAGLDAESDHYFVVMAKAEHSLSDVLNRELSFPSEEATAILLQVANGLAEASHIVHRDLKPANVLFHDGWWKVADFGIARFVEESTSFETLKGCLSPPYAAPEQFRSERATQATDVYALGCVGYTLLTGKPPFSATRFEDYQHQHCNVIPTPILDANPTLRSLLMTMLRKIPVGRPPLERVREVLRFVAGRPAVADVQAGGAELAQVAASLSIARLGEEAEERLAKEARELSRVQLALEVIAELRGAIISRLFDFIVRACPQCKQYPDELELEDVKLQVSYRARPLSESTFPTSKWDVVTGAAIGVFHTPRTGLGWPESRWTAALWYAKLPREDCYRWYEVSYSNYRRPSWDVRFDFSQWGFRYGLPDFDVMDEAMAGIAGGCTLAFGPTPVDVEATTEFVERWAQLFARACAGQLRSD
jgi:hypothetical protein